jgi:predicted lysophospholipase L1 biosynthesis ABC-type transport system permease subunit
LFGAMGIQLHEGRDVVDSDTLDAPLVAVVSQSFVRQYLPGLDPIGRQFDFADAKRRIVGVVGNVRVRGLERESEPQVYLPHDQMPLRGRFGYSPRELVVKASVPPDTLLAPIRGIVRQIDPELPLSMRTFDDIVAEQTGGRMAHIGVVGMFAALSLLLAGIGVHGVLSFAVSQRIPEFGVRIALGASPGRILAMVIRDGVVMASIGCILGLLLGYSVGRSMQSVLAGVQPGDIPTFASAMFLVFVMTVTGSFLPAVRAIRVNPTMSIRTE